MNRNETPVSSRIGRLTTFGELVKLHIEDMTVAWTGGDRTRMLLIRDRKDPHDKQGNDPPIPMFGPGGYDG